MDAIQLSMHLYRNAGLSMQKTPTLQPTALSLSSLFSDFSIPLRPREKIIVTAL